MNRSLTTIFLLLGMTVCALALGAGLESASKIAEIKGTSQESLWIFLKRLPSSFEAQVFYGLFGSGLAGSVASWLWKWSKGESTGWDHFTIKYTIGQVLWLAGSSVGAIATVGFSTDGGEFFGWLSVLWTGGLAGFGGEVKNERKVWTSAERAATPAGPQ